MSTNDKPSSDWVVITTEFDDDDDHTARPHGTVMAVWSDPSDEEKARDKADLEERGIPDYVRDHPFTMIGLEPWTGRAKLFSSRAEAGAAFRAEWGKLSKPWKVVRLTNWESVVARSNADDFYNGYWDGDGNPIGPSSAPGTEVEVAEPGTEITAVVVETLTIEEAQAVTGRIRGNLDDIADELVRAWHGKVWEPLGYSDWDGWIDGEFEGIPLALPRAKRKGSMASMAASGLTTRAIGSVLGVSAATVSRATSTKPKPVANETPAAAVEEPVEEPIAEESVEEPVDVDEVDLPVEEPVEHEHRGADDVAKRTEDEESKYRYSKFKSVYNAAKIINGETVELMEVWANVKLDAKEADKVKELVAFLKMAAANVEDILGV